MRVFARRKGYWVTIKIFESAEIYQYNRAKTTVKAPSKLLPL